MKFIAMNMMAALMISSSSAFAAAPELDTNTQYVEHEVANLLGSKLTFPKFLLLEHSNTALVDVSFRLNEHGQVEVVAIDNASEALKAEVSAQLSSIQLSEFADNAVKTYKVRIRFKVQ